MIWTIIQLVISGIAMGFVYALIGIEYTLIYNASGVLNFSHDKMVSLGAYIYAGMFVLGLGWNSVVSAIASLLLMAVFGILVAYLIFIPLRKQKSMIFTIMGLVHMGRGEVTFDGKKLNRMHAHKICKAGIAYVPEGREVFPNMTVLENLEMGAYCRSYTAAQMNEKLEEMYTMFPRLKERLKQKAGSMSGGEQQMLAIARGLMSDPSMVMLDEPSLGLAPVIVDDVFDVIHNINTVKKLPVILVEQNAYMALSISNRCYVLENGRIAHSGKSSELIQSDVIRETYLGG